MSGIASWLRRYAVELAWGAFAAANLAVMFRIGHAQTVPFHFVWVSLTLVYGFRIWKPQTTLVVCGVVCALTSLAFVGPIMAGWINADEVTEVPLMAAMFLAMVWHARRRAAAMEEVRRLADSERRLRERERDFVRDASHELRTPITVARGYAELIRVANGVSETGEDAGMILVELSKLNQISERMLTLARAGQADFLRPTRVDLEDLVSRTLKRWMIAAPRRWQLEVAADGERLEAALDALIENAVAATGDGGRILIRGRRSDGDAVVDVVDDGIGIEPEHLGHLFDRFWRSERSRATRPGGTGLGLAIVKAIVEAHGGSVSVLSKPGEGTIFTIRVPGLEATGEAAPEPAATALFPFEGAAYPGLGDMAT